MDVRSSRRSTLPMVSPTSTTLPVVGNICAAAKRINVVLPAPFGPTTTQRSSNSTCQSTGPRILRPSRTTVTPLISITRSSASAGAVAGAEINGL